MVTTKDLLKRLREFENSPEGYGYELRLQLATVIFRQLDKKGWTQKRLAEESGMKESFLSRVLHAESNCTLDVMGRLFFALGIKPQLIDRETTASESPVTWHTFSIVENGKGRPYGTQKILAYKIA